MELSVRGRRWLLGVHILLVVTWLGTGLCMTLLVLAHGYDPDPAARAAIAAGVKLLDDALIIPSANGVILTGVLYGLLTRWGFFRYHWVTVKWIVTVALAVFGTFWLGPWLNEAAAIAEAARDVPAMDPVYRGTLGKLIGGGFAQVGILGVLLFLSALKPWGRRGRPPSASTTDAGEET